MTLLLLPARVPSSRWWLNGHDGPAMVRLLRELRCEGPSLWRVPLRATGCQNASEMDARNLDYDSVKAACRRILYAEKLQTAQSIHESRCGHDGEARYGHVIGLRLPATCGAVSVVKFEQMPLPFEAAA